MSEVKTNKLTGVSTAGNITVTSQGGAVTSQLQIGLVNAWLVFDQDTPVITNSINTASVTAHATGQYTQNFTNGFSNDDQAYVPTSQNESTNTNTATQPNQGRTTTTTIGVNCVENGVVTDKFYNLVITCGDLA